MKRIVIPVMGIAVVAGIFAACSKKDDSSGTSTNSSVSGKLSSVSVSSMKPGAHTMTAKTITHIMAVSPSTSSPTRYVAAVGSDGSFSLGLTAGKPYLIVFVAQDGTLTGPDMIAGIVRVSANQLDTLPIAQTGDVALGDVTVDGSTSEATPSTTVSDLLSNLGVTSAEASYIGNIDDLALRLANPDVDNNGVIDTSEGKSFGLDWHVRADTKLSGSDLLMSDIENAFASATNLTLTWTLSSAYAVYPRSFDDTDYVANSGVSTTLNNGGAFAHTDTTIPPTSMSGGTFSEMRQWGPDYNMSSSEMGGSGTSAETFTYTLGSASKQLKYSNVRTKTKAQLSADGVILPFIKLNTEGGKFTGLGYKWMKRSGSAWVDATAAEVSLLVQESGAYLNLYTSKSGSSETSVSFTIPSTSASGTIAVTDSSVRNSGGADLSNLTLASFCSSALSYDDKMGLRIFAGSPKPNAGVTPCY